MKLPSIYPTTAPIFVLGRGFPKTILRGTPLKWKKVERNTTLSLLAIYSSNIRIRTQNFQLYLLKLVNIANSQSTFSFNSAYQSNFSRIKILRGSGFGRLNCEKNL